MREARGRRRDSFAACPNAPKVEGVGSANTTCNFPVDPGLESKSQPLLGVHASCLERVEIKTRGNLSANSVQHSLPKLANVVVDGVLRFCSVASRCESLGTCFNSEISRCFQDKRPWSFVASPRCRARQNKRRFAAKLADCEVWALHQLTSGGCPLRARQRIGSVAVKLAFERAMTACRSVVEAPGGRLGRLWQVAGLPSQVEAEPAPCSVDCPFDDALNVEDYGCAGPLNSLVEIAELNAERLSVPLTAAVLPVPEHLTGEQNALYDNPPQPECERDKPATGFFHSSPTQWRAAVRKMLRASMIDIRPGSKFDTRLSAGAFCLVKPDGTLRLICDRRAGNSFEKLIGKARLPNPSRLSRILLPKSHCIRMSSRDLKDYYFALGVSEQRKLRQAWGPRIPSSWLDDLNNGKF